MEFAYESQCIIDGRVSYQKINGADSDRTRIDTKDTSYPPLKYVLCEIYDKFIQEASLMITESQLSFEMNLVTSCKKPAIPEGSRAKVYQVTDEK